MRETKAGGQDNLTEEELFRLRQELESLTRRYIERLKESKVKVEDRASWLTSIIEAVGDGLLVFDADKKVVLANEAAFKFAGWNVSDLERADFRRQYQFYVGPDLSTCPPDQEPLEIALREKRTVEMEGLLKGRQLPEGGVWIRAHASPITSAEGDIMGGVTVFNDITERKTLQRQRDALSALITHDLKNHMTAEQLFFGMILDEPESLIPKFKPLLVELQNSNRRFVDIARTLLELHRTELFFAELTPEVIDLKGLLESAIQLNSQLASLRHIDFTLTVPSDLPTFTSAPSALHQVFHNLIQNAVHVSPDGSAVEITAAKTDSGLIIDIKDSGPGMSPEEVAQLLDVSRGFSRRSASLTSSGLGLYLCRMLVEQHGGRLSCQSTPGSGTTLSVRLPARHPRDTR